MNHLTKDLGSILSELSNNYHQCDDTSTENEINIFRENNKTFLEKFNDQRLSPEILLKVFYQAALNGKMEFDLEKLDNESQIFKKYYPDIKIDHLISTYKDFRNSILELQPMNILFSITDSPSLFLTIKFYDKSKARLEIFDFENFFSVYTIYDKEGSIISKGDGPLDYCILAINFNHYNKLFEELEDCKSNNVST